MLRNKQQTDAHSNHVDDGEFIHSGTERIKNPLDQHKLPANEATLIISIPFVEKATVIAPEEEFTPLSFINDSHCEELAFPYLLPTVKFECLTKRNVPLSRVKYFNQRLLNYNQKFASDSNFILC